MIEKGLEKLSVETILSVIKISNRNKENVITYLENNIDLPVYK